MNKKLFSLGLLIVSAQFNTYAVHDYRQALKAKQAAQDEQPEASSSQHPSGFFGFDPSTIRHDFEPIIGTAGSHGIGQKIKIKEDSTIEGHADSYYISNNDPTPTTTLIDYIAAHYDELMTNTKIEEDDDEATIQDKIKLRENLLIEKSIIETKKMLALCIEMQKKQKEEQAAKAAQDQDPKAEKASSSHGMPF